MYEVRLDRRFSVLLKLDRGSAPDPGSVACGGPDAPRRSLAGALCAPKTVDTAPYENKILARRRTTV